MTTTASRIAAAREQRHQHLGGTDAENITNEHGHRPPARWTARETAGQPQRCGEHDPDHDITAVLALAPPAEHTGADAVDEQKPKQRIHRQGERSRRSGKPDLGEHVRGSLGSADYSSVFRSVTLLEREGVVDRIDLGEGRARFELRDGHHEHRCCERCGRIDEVPGCVLDDVVAQTQARPASRVTSHKVVFAGVCGACSAGG